MGLQTSCFRNGQFSQCNLRSARRESFGDTGQLLLMDERIHPCSPVNTFIQINIFYFHNLSNRNPEVVNNAILWCHPFSVIEFKWYSPANVHRTLTVHFTI